jgi:L-cystine transport system permease protein
MNFEWKYFWDAVSGGIIYLPTTLALSLLTLLIGLLFGGVIALCRVFKVKVLSQIFMVYIAITKAIPANLIIVVMNLLFTNYFNVVMQALHINLTVRDVDKLFIGVFALSISAIASISENIRSALSSVPIEQYEAGYSVGLTKYQTFVRIIVPQAVLTLLPSLVNTITGLIKMTSLAMLVGVTDILNGMLIRASITFGYLEAYFAASLVYWGMSVILEQVGKYLEKYVGRYKLTN